MTHKIVKEKNSKVELEVTYTAAEFAPLWDKAFKAVQAEIEIDGFRKGNAPENAILAKYGESAILNEMANIAINESYPKIVISEKIKVIAEPHIHVVALEKDKDFTYHAHVPVYPEFTLGDYKNIISEDDKKIKEIPETTDEEVEKVMEQIDEKVKAETPDIKDKIKENMKSEKEMIEKSRVRGMILEKIVSSVESKNPDCWPEGFTEKDKAQIIILEIAKAEKIEVTKEEIEAEMMKVMMYMNPEEINKNNLDEEKIRSYSEQIIINEKVLTMLEK